jgi:hypothetical protein
MGELSHVRDRKVMHTASYTNKGTVVSEALVPFGQARPFQTGSDRSGGVE